MTGAICRAEAVTTTLPEHLGLTPGFLCGSSCSIFAFLCIVFCRSLFVLFLLAIVFSVLLQFTTLWYIWYPQAFLNITTWPSQVSERLICVLRVPIFTFVTTIFLFDFGTVLRVWSFLMSFIFSPIRRLIKTLSRNQIKITNQQGKGRCIICNRC